MGLFDHLKHLIEDEITGGHHRRHHGGHHGHHYDHHYDHHYSHHYDPHYDPTCDPNYVDPRRAVPRPVQQQQPNAVSAAPCAKCGKFNPSHVLFCQQCGQSLAGDGADVACAGCGTQIAASAKFCGQCGRPQV